MGNYRKLIKKLTQYGNCYTQVYNKPVTREGPDAVTVTEMQVFEYILENEEKKTKMVQIAQQIGISTSRLTKVAAKLETMGYLEKRRKVGNKKEVYIFITEEGRQMYKEYTREMLAYPYGPFFEALKNIPGEHLDSFTQAMDILIESTKEAQIGRDAGSEEEFIPIKKP